MATELEKLKTLLAELFQLDAAEDLDFGMYRVLRLRREELTKFLDTTLAAEVERAMGSVAHKERTGVEAKMRQIEEQAAQFNARPDNNAEYVKLKAMLSETGDAASRERQVYAHLTEFFARYYEDGDFLSLPRMRKDTYAIPYDGSEVVLHWANKDQYYVKSGEYFTRYAFQLGDGRRVVFRLVDANTDPDNVKSTEAGKRRFVLCDGESVKVEDGELVCRFVYAAAEGKQDAINVSTEARIVEGAPPAWREGLQWEKPGQTSKDKASIVGWHLRQYTEKNKRDYFIHKDLGGFLRRELDHYLKTEVFDLDSVDAMGSDDVGRAVTMVKTIRAVARPLIMFLASIEDFQKRLFLKKRMVLRTDWCVTLDRVPEEFYAEIAANKAQVARWKDLFAIDEIEVPPMVPGGDGKGETVSVEFLKRNQGLMVESRFLTPASAARLTHAIGADVDERTTGTLFRGDNLQAARLFGAATAAPRTLVFSDPPYNTGNDGFMYKDGYSHSSWLAMAGGVFAALAAIPTSGSLVVTIDDNEMLGLATSLRQLLGADRHDATVVWQKRDTPANDAKRVTVTHDYVLLFQLGDGFEWHSLPRTEQQSAVYKNQDSDERGVWTRASLTRSEVRQDRLYAVTAPSGRSITPPAGNSWRVAPERFASLVADRRIWWGQDGDGTPYEKKFLSEGKEGVVPTTWWDYSTGGSNRNAKLEIRDLFGAEAPFSTPKPTRLVELLARLTGAQIALDAFAGSGTTGHAVLNLNREDDGHRKFILVEVNDYFDTVLLPRILKATYSENWKDGKPVDRKPVPGGALYKVLYLESYEDTLANITLPPPPSDNPLPLHLRSEYTVRYMLDQETRLAVLDLDRFRKPFGWTMEVRRGGLVTKDHPVDLVETFNYLIALHVSRYGYFRDANRIRYVEGTVKEDGNDRRVLVLWRDCDLVPDDELVRLFDDREFAPVSSREYDRIYVNGDPPLANIKRPDEQWKVLAIEDEFKRLSFADDEV